MARWFTSTLRRIARRLRHRRPTLPWDRVNVWTRNRAPYIAENYYRKSQLARLEQRLQPGLAIYGLFRAELGVGQGARQITRSLRSAGFPVTAHNISLPHIFKQEVEFDLADGPFSNFRNSLIYLNADTYLDILGTDQLPFAAVVGRHRIGYWHWELPIFPPRLASAFEKVDEIWTSSQFSADAINSATSKCVQVVPHAIKVQEVETQLARASLNIPLDRFVFLCIFDYNSKLSRKNPMATIRAFLDAFPSHSTSSPILIVKCHGSDRRASELRLIQELTMNDSRVILIDEVFDETQMSTLQNACDAFVSLHRSEGFGLNIAECMALGKLVIVTGFSGNMDFTSEQNSLLIPFSIRLLKDGDYVHGRGQWWAEPEHDAAVSAMQRAAFNSSSLNILRVQARDDMRRLFNSDVVARKAISALGDRSAATRNLGGAL